MLNRRQFQAIARIIGRADGAALMADDEIQAISKWDWEMPTPAQDVVTGLVNEFCEFMADENPLFNKETFLEAVDAERQDYLESSGVSS